jgi:hypothetical protein
MTKTSVRCSSQPLQMGPVEHGSCLCDRRTGAGNNWPFDNLGLGRPGREKLIFGLRLTERTPGGAPARSKMACIPIGISITKDFEQNQ